MDEENAKKPYSDKRWYDDPEAVVLLCSYCRHRITYYEDTDIIRCTAFPAGIPDDVLSATKGKRDLNKECNNGIKFEHKNKKEDK